MDETRIISIMKGLRKQATTEELLQALNENNQKHWSEEGFEAIKQVLRERNINFKEFPRLNEISEAKQFNVKFRTNIKNIKGNCPYLGKGQIVMSQYGLKILGKISYSLGWQIFFGTLILIFFIMLSHFLSLNKIYAPSIFIIWFVVKIFIRKRHNILIPWKDIISIETEPKWSFIGIKFAGFEDSSPVVFKSESYNTIISEMYKKIFIKIDVESEAKVKNQENTQE